MAVVPKYVNNCNGRRSVGTVLMECVLVLPIITFFIFAIVQFALIWYADIMTHYAAYNAARAMLVYHPSEYTTTNKQEQVILRSRSGVSYLAACQSLAWVGSAPSISDTSSASPFGIPGWWPVGNGNGIEGSDYITNQVRIVSTLLSQAEANSSVRVTVEFDYPLLVPAIGRAIAEFEGNDLHPQMNVEYIKLKATAMLPKPYRTTRYARLEDESPQNDSALQVIERIIEQPIFRPPIKPVPTLIIMDL